MKFNINDVIIVIKDPPNLKKACPDLNFKGNIGYIKNFETYDNIEYANITTVKFDLFCNDNRYNCFYGGWSPYPL